MVDIVKYEDEAKRLHALLRIAEPGSQKDFGEKFGISKSTCSTYFRGINRIPVEIALKVADHYRVTLDWIYGGVERTLISEVRDKIRQAENEIA